jgi:formate hydrogenlyase transcriptional activator
MIIADLWERIELTYRRVISSWPGRYAFAFLAVMMAAVLQFALRLLGFAHLPYALFVPAVVLVALVAGLWPGVMATVLATVVGGYFLFSPANSKTHPPEDWAKPVLFLIAGTAFTAIVYGRTRAKQALRVTESDLNHAQAVAQIGSWHFDMKDGRLRLSDEAHRILGLPKGLTISPLEAREMVHTEDRERVDAAWLAGVKRGVYGQETRVLVNGQTRWLRIQASLERGPGGQTTKVTGTLQDITEWKLVQQRLQEYKRAVEGVEEIITVVDRDYRFIIANDAFLKYRGAQRENVIGRLTPEVVGREVFESTIKDNLDDCFKGKVVQFEMRYNYPMLGERDLLVTYYPIEGSAGIDRVACVTLDVTEKKWTIEQLHASEDRYRDLVEHSEDLLCTHDLEGNLLTVNPAPARILGYTVEEMLKIPMREMIVPGGHELFDQYLGRLRTTGAPEKGLLYVMTKIGEVRIWEYYNTLRTEGVEKPIVRGMAHDVTERRRAELALGDSEQRYRMLFEKTVAGVGIISVEGEIIDCNDAWAHMYGYASAAECRGTSVAQHYVELADRQALLERLRTGGTVTDQELHLRRKDGTEFWILVNDVWLRDSQNRGLIQATVVDITARKQAESALRESEERFRVALKQSPVTVFHQDRDLRYTWIYNPHLYLQDAVIGKNDEEILGKKAAAQLHEFKRRVLETGAALREEVVIPHEGKNYATDLTIEPLFDGDKKIIGITGASMDIALQWERANALRDAKDRLAQEKSYLESEIETELGFEEIIGQSAPLREVLKKARVVAPTDSTVLLLGESGTGKELVARAVHALSTRHERNFIKLNCAAVPSGLLESELFGHERGAFTGAVSQKIGRVELADKGTLFLDEIGELPLELQPKLLRLLQDREFERLGGVQTLRVDVRIISATNRDLQQEVAERKFREDLFYRLNVFPIQMPTLRERRSDIPILVHHFVRKHATRMGKHIEDIPSETVKVLENWNWPGNIRELENMIERMVILTNGPVLAAPPEELLAPQGVPEDDFVEMERDHLVRILRETNGVLAGPDGAAIRLGLKRTTLQSMLKRFGIEPREFRRITGTFSGE